MGLPHLWYRNTTKNYTHWKYIQQWMRWPIHSSERSSSSISNEKESLTALVLLSNVLPRNMQLVHHLCFYHLKVRSDLIPSPPTYNTKYGYLSWESYYNISYYTRLLPPVPKDCPLPMGTKGETFNQHTHTLNLKLHTRYFQPQAIMSCYWHVSLSAGKPILPDPKVLAERFFKRKKFRPDPQGTNLMFAFMAQHFTHQFFKTNYGVQGGFTKALGHGVRRILTFSSHLQPRSHLNKPVDNHNQSDTHPGRCGQYIWRQSHATASTPASWRWKAEISGIHVYEHDCKGAIFESGIQIL